jgi:hypothetical protein
VSIETIVLLCGVIALLVVVTMLLRRGAPRSPQDVKNPPGFSYRAGDYRVFGGNAREVGPSELADNDTDDRPARSVTVKGVFGESLEPESPGDRSARRAGGTGGPRGSGTSGSSRPSARAWPWPHALAAARHHSPDSS